MEQNRVREFEDSPEMEAVEYTQSTPGIVDFEYGMDRGWVRVCSPTSGWVRQQWDFNKKRDRLVAERGQTIERGDVVFYRAKSPDPAVPPRHRTPPDPAEDREKRGDLTLAEAEDLYAQGKRTPEEAARACGKSTLEFLRERTYVAALLPTEQVTELDAAEVEIVKDWAAADLEAAQESYDKGWDCADYLEKRGQLALAVVFADGEIRTADQLEALHELARTCLSVDSPGWPERRLISRILGWSPRLADWTRK